MRTVIVKLLVLVGLCAAVVVWCNCDNPDRFAPEVDDLLGYSFAPSLALLDTAFVGGRVAESVVSLHNQSENPLTLTTFESDCPSGVTWSISTSTIDGGSSANLTLYFSPIQAYGESRCTLSPRFVGHQSVGDTKLEIKYAAGEAACALEPEGPHEFGLVGVGGSANRTMTISNITSEVIPANQFEYGFESPSSDCSYFPMEDDESTGIVRPDAPKDVTVRFQPDDDRTFECQRVLVSRSLAGINDHPIITSACPTQIVWRGTGVAVPSQWSACQPEGTTDWQGIFGFSGSEVFITGEGGSMLQSAGDCQWESVGTIPGDVQGVTLTDLWGHSDGTETVVYAVGNIPPEPGFFSETGAIVRWDGSDWAIVDRDGLHTYASVWGSSPENVYFGGAGVATDFPNAKHWDGNILNPFQISDMGMSNVVAINGIGPSEIWAVMDQDYNSVYRFNGTQWENKTPPFITEPLRDVEVYTTTLQPKVIAVGRTGAIYHYDGSDWEDVSISGESRDFHAVWVSPNGRIFVAGEDQAIYLGHVDDLTEWVPMTPPPGTPDGDFLDVWGSSDEDVYAGGTGGVVIRLEPAG